MIQGKIYFCENDVHYWKDEVSILLGLISLTCDLLQCIHSSDVQNQLLVDMVLLESRDDTIIKFS